MFALGLPRARLKRPRKGLRPIVIVAGDLGKGIAGGLPLSARL
jgi:hypothetical protein